MATNAPINTLLAAMGLGAAMSAVPAAAQSADQANGSGKAVLLSPLNFINDTDLNFGSVVLPIGGNGSVTIDPNPAAPVLMTATGVTPISTSLPSRGVMDGAGTRNRVVLVTTTFPTRLYRNGVTGSPQSLPVSLRLDRTPLIPNLYFYTVGADATFRVYVGGTVTIPAGTADGGYSALYTVTANYF